MESSEPTSELTLLRTPRNGDRRIAGVCGALAQRWHVDPLLIRVAAVLLLLSSGVGAVLYAAGWLFMPARPESTAPIAHVFPGAPRWSRTRVVWTVVICSIVVALIVGAYTPGGAMPLIILAAVWFFARRRKNRQQAQSRQAVAPPPVAAPMSAYYAAWPATYQQPVTPTGVPATEFDRAVQAWQRRLHQVAITQDSAPVTFTDPPVQPSPARRPAPSWGRGLALIGIAAGVFLFSLLVFGISSAAVISPLLAPASLALGVIAVGLLVGSRVGRPRLAVPVGLVLSLIVVVSIAVPFDTIRVPTVRSTEVAGVEALPPDGIVVEGQALDLDLSSLGVDAHAEDVTLPITVQGGLLDVTLPADYTVVVIYTLNGGFLDLPSESYAGTSEGTWSSETTDGPTLTLLLDIQGGAVSIS